MKTCEKGHPFFKRILLFDECFLDKTCGWPLRRLVPNNPTKIHLPVFSMRGKKTLCWSLLVSDLWKMLDTIVTSSSSWWLNQPIWKIWVKMGSSSPIFGVKIKNMGNHHLVFIPTIHGSQHVCLFYTYDPSVRQELTLLDYLDFACFFEMARPTPKTWLKGSHSKSMDPRW